VKSVADIWRQKTVPVIYQPDSGQPLMVRMPWSPENFNLLRGDGHRKPQWNRQFKCWEIPRAWLDKVIRMLIQKYRRAYFIHAYRAHEKCAPACWDAKGAQCECSCLGKNHGAGCPGGRWYIVSDACAVLWHGRELAYRLLEAP
jgi:hypothetical protein